MLLDEAQRRELGDELAVERGLGDARVRAGLGNEAVGSPIPLSHEPLPCGSPGLPIPTQTPDRSENRPRPSRLRRTWRVETDRSETHAPCERGEPPGQGYSYVFLYATLPLRTVNTSVPCETPSLPSGSVQRIVQQ